MRRRISWPEPWLRRTRIIGEKLSYSSRDFIIAMGLYLVAVILCLFLQRFDPESNTSYVAMIFLLDVFLTACFTEGYFFSTLMSVACVLSVDYIFTSPYWQISFTLAGFPVTFFVMLTISVITGVVTSRAKEVESMHREAEHERIHANLLRAISHDIRTPLTAIMGCTAVLAEQENISDEQRRELAQNAHDEAQWLIRTVENLLSITRVGVGGEDRLVKVSTVVEEVVEGSVAKLHKRYPDMPVEVHLPEEVLLAPTDPLLIEQVLLNLMENAVIHGETTTGITLDLMRHEDKVRVVVSDDGIGIPSGRRKDIFSGENRQPRRGDERRSMGIGLSVCKAVIDAHGGIIRVEDNPGGGARFIIEIPMEDREDESQG